MTKKTFQFRFLDTPVAVEPTVLASLVNVGGLALWLTRKQPGPRQVRFGLLAVINYVIMDFIHFGGHIISSRLAAVPIDEVQIKFPFPMSYYRNQDVSPEQHQLRAIGGPVASALAMLDALLLRLITRPGSLLRDFANVAAISNFSIAVGSLFPVPFIDGGSLLKWQLVKNGRSPEQADEVVKQAYLGVRVAAVVIGSLFAMRKLLSR